MISAIRKFFDQNLTGGDTAHSRNTPEQRLQLATAAMLIEVMSADDQWQPVEQEKVFSILRKMYALSEAETRALIDLAKREADDAIDHYQFTSLINSHYSRTEKMSLIEHLWAIAYADGHLDKYEDHAIRKLSELLHIDHKDFVIAKHRAEQVAKKS